MTASFSTSAKPLGFLVAWLLATAWAEDRIVDQIVAVVNGSVITQSELEFEVKVALIEHGGIAAAKAKLDNSTLQSGLELAISQRVANNEAERLQAFVVEPNEIEAAVSNFRKRFSDDADFQNFLNREDADLSLLETVLGRSLRAEKYLNSKVRLRAQVSDAEMRRYFDEHASQFAGGFEASKEVIGERLMRDRYERLIRAEMAQARRNADVRILFPFVRPGDAR